MNKSTFTPPWQRAGFWIVLIVFMRMAVQLYAANSYGYFVDEFYYLACAEKLAFGYVDQPPFSIWLLAITQFFLGDSLIAIRLPVILIGAATVWIAGKIAREMGADQFGQIACALLVALTPVELGMQKFYSMNAFDLFFWALYFWLVVRILNNNQLRYWLWLGVAMGLGLLNKHSLIFFGAGVGAGMLLTENRKMLIGPGPYLCGAIAFAIALPHLIWQWTSGWPTLEFANNATLYKNFFTPAHFLVGQILENHPLFFPVWLAGLVALLLAPGLRQYRLIGLSYLAILAIFLIKGAKTYYLAAAYPPLLAAGATWLSHRLIRPVLRATFVSLVLAGGIALLPMSLPLLPPARYIAYETFLGLRPPKMEMHASGPMPQHFADMLGWLELQRATRALFHTLTPEEQKQTVILGANYGYAGALQFARRKHPELPQAGSGHNNYYLWGPPLPASGKEPEIIIALGFQAEMIAPFCKSVEKVPAPDCPYCLVGRKEDLLLCRGPAPLHKNWPALKKFI